MKPVNTLLLKWLCVGIFLIIVIVCAIQMIMPPQYLLLEAKNNRYVILKINPYSKDEIIYRQRQRVVSREVD